MLHQVRLILGLSSLLLLSGCEETSKGAGYTPTEPAATQDSGEAPFPESHKLERLAKIGPENCVQCHAQEVAAWQGSHHAKANRPVSVAKDAAAFTPTRRIEESGVTYEMLRHEDSFQLRVIDTEGASTTYTLVGVIGDSPIRQYLAHLQGNRLQTISASYDVQNDRWFDVFAGQAREPDEWGHWSGQGMNWNANCANCHMTEYQKHFDFESNRYDSTWTQQGLACAECHSGLEEHLAAAQSGDYRHGLKALDRAQTEDNCASCHSRRDQLTTDAFLPGDAYHDHFSLSLPDQANLYHPDGQILDEVFVHASFEMSRMGHAGVSCVDCHDPHSMQPILPVENNMLCMRCHEHGTMEAPIIRPVEHSFHPAGSTGNQCVQCHMPKTTYMQVDPRADHGFHSPDPLMTKELGIPNACNNCHSEQSINWAVEHAESWYGERLAAKPQRQRARALSKAYAYDPAGLQELLTLAAQETIPAWQATYTGLIANYLPNSTAETHLRGLLDHESPLVRARAISGLARVENSSHALIETLADSSRTVRIAAARSLAARREAIPDSTAAQEWQQYLEFNADRPQDLLILADQAASKGRPTEVLELTERARSLDAANPEIYHQIAILLSSAGHNKVARKQLFRGWELAPKNASFPYSLGLLAAEADDYTAAVGYLEESVALEPQFYRAWYNLSLAYRKLQRPEDAARAMQRAQAK